MYPELVENLNQAHFALQKVLVTLGHLRKKVSKFSGSYCRLELKGRIVLTTDEKKGNIYLNQ